MPIKGFTRRGADFASWIKWSHLDATWSGLGNDDIAFRGIIADFKFIRIGWGFFAPGERPQWIWSATLDTLGPQPGKGWRKAIGLRWLFPDGLVRETKTTSAGLCDIIIKLYGEFELTPDFTAGRMPIIDQIDIVDAEINGSTIYDPVLKIAGSRPCPAEFAEPPTPEPTTSAPKTGTSGGSALRLVDPLDDTIPF
jgi:hypothetical protein